MNVTRAKKVFGAVVVALALGGSLQGCVLLVAGATGGGLLVAADRRSVGAQTEDREIQVKTVAQFAKNLPDQAHVDVASFNRRVLLTGEAPDAQTKQLADDLARQVPNVQGVVNEIAIQGASSLVSRSNDSYLTGKVKAQLVNEKDLSANFFKVVTERANVYLMGLVTPAEGDRAAEIASETNGVDKVIKVFQYITPDEAAKLSLGKPPEPASGAAPVATTPPPPAETGATTVGVPDAGVTAQPLDANPTPRPTPAPIQNSSPVHTPARSSK